MSSSGLTSFAAQLTDVRRTVATASGMSDPIRMVLFRKPVFGGHVAGLFVVHEDGKLTPLAEMPYHSEDYLQKLLADYPDLLGGDQMGNGVPRQWMFVTREASVPDSEYSSGRWSLDHLFLDQDAVPTFVEVKRATDSRLRREVVGQMLDYAANGLKYWPVEAIQGFLIQDGGDLNQRLVEAFGPQVDTESYWQRLGENLAEGRIRLLFVADKIPSELLAVVEFLNAHMDHTEVLAVEVPQFVGEGLRTLAPRVLGQTQAAILQKGTARRPSRKWDEESYFAVVNEELPPDQAAFVRKYYDWIKDQGWQIVFGKGSIYGSFWGRFKVNGSDCVYPVVCGISAMEFGFAWLSAPFDEDEKRRELVRRMNLIPGADFSEDTSTPGNKYPNRPIALLAQPGAFEILTEAIEWYKSEVEKAAELQALGA